MHEFIAKHQDKVAGTLSGFDRLVFRGHLRSIGYPDGMMSYLWTNQVLLKNFGDHVEKVTERLKEASLAEAKASGRPVRYLNSSHMDKETIARNILAQDKVRSGLVCVLSCLEPCLTFTIHRNRLTKKLELQLSPRKCLFLYHYQIHPVFGFLNARIQTWFPFSIQICLNGREWLARQMQAAGLDYLQQDNCFPWIADWSTAQRLMDKQLKTKWPKLLNGIARQLNPIRAKKDLPEKKASLLNGRERGFSPSSTAGLKLSESTAPVGINLLWRPRTSNAMERRFQKALSVASSGRLATRSKKHVECFPALIPSIEKRSTWFWVLFEIFNQTSFSSSLMNWAR